MKAVPPLRYFVASALFTICASVAQAQTALPDVEDFTIFAHHTPTLVDVYEHTTKVTGQPGTYRFSKPAHGTIQFVSRHGQEQGYYYFPNGDFKGSDSFTYTYTDNASGAKDTATVTVEDRMQGVDGLFFGGIGEERFGPPTALQFFLSRRGIVSGKYRGTSFITNVDGQGKFVVRFNRSGFSVTIDPATRRFTGESYAYLGQGEVSIEPDVFGTQLSYSAANPSPQAGQYTFILQPNSAPQPSSQFTYGTGYGRMTVNKAGLVTVAGKLFEGVAFSATSGIFDGNRCTFYAPVPVRTFVPGEVLGSLKFDPASGDDAAGAVSYYREVRRPNEPLTDPNGQTYQQRGLLQASRYDPNAPRLQVSGTADNVKVAFDLETELARFISWGSNETITVEPSDGVTLNIHKNTGFFSGTFLNPETKKVQGYQGAFLQRQNLGAGLFYKSHGGGTVTITPVK